MDREAILIEALRLIAAEGGIWPAAIASEALGAVGVDEDGESWDLDAPIALAGDDQTGV